jgi:hypothetical protein
MYQDLNNNLEDDNERDKFQSRKFTNNNVVDNLIMGIAFVVILSAIHTEMMVINNVIQYWVIRRYYNESQIQSENLKFVHTKHRLELSNGDILPSEANSNYSQLCLILKIPIFAATLAISGLGMLYLYTVCPSISSYLIKRFEIVIGIMIGNEDFSFENKRMNLNFQYEQSEELFILRHQHHRYGSIIMFCIFAFPYSFIFFSGILEFIRIGFNISSLFVVLIIPVIFLLVCLYFYSYREIWILDPSGLTQNFNAIFYSTTRHIPLYDLHSIEYIDKLQDKNNLYPTHWPHVVAKTHNYTSIIYCSSSLFNVTAAECRHLADTMQDILLTLQEKQDIVCLSDTFDIKKSKNCSEIVLSAYDDRRLGIDDYIAIS